MNRCAALFRHVCWRIHCLKHSDNPLQAQMQFLVGQAALNEKDYEKALESLTRARDLTPSSKVPELDTILLVCRLLGCVS